MAPLRAEESCFGQQSQFNLLLEVHVKQLSSTFICQHIGRSDDWIFYRIFCNAVTRSCKYSFSSEYSVDKKSKEEQWNIELPAIRTEDNRHRDSIACFSLSQTHSFHGKFFWKHGISSGGKKDRSSPSPCLSRAHTNKSEWPKICCYSDQKTCIVLYLSTLLPGVTYLAGSATCIQIFIRPSCNLVALRASSSCRNTMEQEKILTVKWDSIQTWLFKRRFCRNQI